MEIECRLKIFLLVLALASGGVAARAAQPQSSNVRVGPASEESTEAPPPAKKDEGRTQGRPEAKKDSGKDSKRVKGVAGSAERQADAARAEKASAETATANASKVAATGETTPRMTSDAPAKNTDAPVVPVTQPKSSLSADPPNVTKPATNGGPPAANTAAAVNNPTPPAAPSPTSVYRVGVGDVLDIRLFNHTTRESTLFTVMAGGLVEYPLAGAPVNVAGMTTEDIGVRIAAELRRRAVYDKPPQVLVSVRDYGSHTVLVSGLVNDPGVKILRREAIPLYVVIAEAQPKPEAGRAVVMSHATGKSTSVDLADTQALNMLVQSSDVVNVIARPQEFFYIGGEVGAPGQKDFHHGMTLTQAVLASGGSTRLASGVVRVSRQSADGRLVSTNYDLGLIQGGKIPDPSLQAGDRIEIERKKSK